MKVSIITVTKNSAATVRRTLESVAGQTHSDIEHIIIDGASNDDTLEIVNGFSHVAKVISEPDQGMYDALNKGLNLASGDVVGILHSDDIYHDDTIIEKVVEGFSTHQVDSVFGDIRFVTPNDRNKTQRYYSSAHWHPGKFGRGYMPAHPSFFVKRDMYELYGTFQPDYEIAADYELLIRFLYTHKVSYKYLDLLMVDMLTGGLSNSSPYRRYILNKEIVRGCRENGIRTSMFKVSLKYFAKIFEYKGNGRKR